MPYCVFKALLLAVAALHSVDAHTVFTNFFIDGAPQGDGTCVRMSNNIPQASFPISSITSNDMACGVNGNIAVSRVCAANANAVLTFEFRTWPDASHVGSIDPSHKGPCAVYMKKVDSALANDTAAGEGWFKIFSEDYDASTGKWCTEKLIDNNGRLSVNIPSDIQGGYYLVRPELLALHQADKTPPNPQFYVGCAQVFLSSGGSSVPEDTVSIPGYVNMTKDAGAMAFNIWAPPMKLPYPTIGPPVYAPSPKRGLGSRAVQQKEGLPPAGCVLANANWCGIEISSYSDETGCWNASKDCWSQNTDCYNNGGATGSKHCPIWEAKCRGIQDACNAKNFHGPPNQGKNLTPPLPYPSSLPPPEPVLDRTAKQAKWVQSSPTTITVSASPSSSLAPVSIVAVPPSNGGSTDQCGPSNGDLKCASGLCCSSHGYCGTSDDYCGTDCQSSYGICGKVKRSHRHSHIMRRRSF